MNLLCNNPTLYNVTMQNSFIDFLVELKLHGVLVWGSSPGAEFGSLIPASSLQDILDNFVLSTLWGRFGDGLSLLERCCTPAQRGRSIWMRTFSAEEVDCMAQPHRLTTFHILTNYFKVFSFSIQPQFFFRKIPLIMFHCGRTATLFRLTRL